MPERGGPTAQAGISYQNGIAALYMGRTLDATRRSPRERVVEVRVEAPVDVDDVVARMATGDRRFIQAKIALAARGKAWTKLWRDVAAQVSDPCFSDDDAVYLYIGHHDALASNLRNCCERATNALNLSEWLFRLGEAEKRVIAAIARTLWGTNELEKLLALLRRVRIELVPRVALERDYAPLWMPESTATPEALFNALCSVAAQGSAVRDTYDGRRLRQLLGDIFGIQIHEPKAWGVLAYRRIIIGRAVIEVPGTSVVRPIRDVFLWPRAERYDLGRNSSYDDDEPDWFYGVHPDDVDLSLFPSNEVSRLVVTGGPGVGKSALTRALAERACERNLLPALISIPEFAKADLDIVPFLEKRLNSAHLVNIDWEVAAESGILVLMLDGLDEVASSRRTIILERLKTFSLRHPSVSWLLTVRDAAALSAPLDSIVVQISALDSGQIGAMIERYCSEAPELARRVTMKIDGNVELSRLARIPLFLAILLATATRVGEMPRNRSQVLEAFLDLLFRPEQFKPTDIDDTEPATSRLIAQEAAFWALEREETSISRRALESIIREADPPTASTERIIAKLSAGGILRSSWPASFAFPFPIVQEYLAAQHVLRTEPGGIAARLQLAVKRPWAQTIQFAIEDHPLSDEIIRLLIERDDDAFWTNLRLAARCVVNGAKVSSDTRAEITRRLATVWATSGWHIRRRVGELIVDGFSNPVLPELREQLAKPWLLYDGANAIIARLRDHVLTRCVLHQVLRDGDYIPFHLPELQAVIDDLGDEALDIYLERSKRSERDDIHALGSLIADLAGANISEEKRVAVAADEALPIELSVAAVALMSGALDGKSELTIHAAIDQGSSGARRLAVRTLKKSANVCGALDTAILTNSGRPDVQCGILDCLGEALPDASERISYLRALVRKGLSADITDRIHVFLAAHGDLSSMKSLVASFHDASHEIICATLLVFGHHRDRALVASAAKKLQNREFGPDERVSLIGSAVSGFTSKIEMTAFRTGALRQTAPHPGLDIIRPLLEGFAAQFGYSADQLLSVDLGLTILGSSLALARLPKRVTEIAASLSAEDNNHEVSHALHEIGSRGILMPIVDLELIASRNHSNAGRAAVDLIARYFTAEALDILIRIHADATDRFFKDDVLDAIERLSGRLGLRVTYESTRLKVAEI